MMEVNNVGEINKNFYDRLYKKKNLFIDIIYPFISFDQQSKSKANFSFIKKVLKKNGSRILDFGFGHGSFLLKFPRQSQLFGADISIEAVINFPRTAKLLGRYIRTCTPDCIGEVVETDSLDLVCLSHVLEHVEDDNMILNQLKCFIKKDGYLLINVPINEVWRDPKHVRTYDLQKVNRLLKENGFTIIDSMEFDKITAFFLEHEQNRKPNTIKKIGLRSFRLLLSFAPFRTYRFLEKSAFRKYSNQQLLVLAKKA